MENQNHVDQDQRPYVRNDGTFFSNKEEADAATANEQAGLQTCDPEHTGRECEDSYPCQYHDTRPQFYSAAIYHTELCNGGPEEGGWWYDSGEPSETLEHVVLTRMFGNQDEAWDYAREILVPVCGQENQGLYPKSSVLSGGVFEARVQRGYPAAFPQERPHYE